MRNPLNLCASSAIRFQHRIQRCRADEAATRHVVSAEPRIALSGAFPGCGISGAPGISPPGDPRLPDIVALMRSRASSVMTSPGAACSPCEPIGATGRAHIGCAHGDRSARSGPVLSHMDVRRPESLIPGGNPGRSRASFRAHFRACSGPVSGMFRGADSGGWGGGHIRGKEEHREP